MTREHRDPYVVLGVGRQASPAEIAHAYRRAARATHPDSSSAGAASVEGFRAVSDAYETLRDPGRRAAYDRAHPPVRRTARVSPPAGGRSVRYGSPDGRHIVLGGAERVPSSVGDGPAPVAELVLRLLLSI
jgi:curved DNA-binding protein CbpA